MRLRRGRVPGSGRLPGPRWRRGLFAMLSVGVALSLAGCDMYPGVAARVNGTDISQSKVDDLVAAACDFTEAAGQSGPTPLATLRRAIVTSLVSITLADQAADAMQLTVSAASVATYQGTQIPATLSAKDKAVLTPFFDDYTKSQLQVALIGAHLSDPSITDSTQLTSDTSKAGQAYLVTYAQSSHVEVNPAYGVWSSTHVTQADGSLSQAQSGIATTFEGDASSGNSDSDLPASQVCG